jgi:hypothetical protein
LSLRYAADGSRFSATSRLATLAAEAILVLLDQLLDFGGIGSKSLVHLGHCWSLTSSPGMTNTSANHYHTCDWSGRFFSHAHFFSQRIDALVP